jgi:glutamate-5-semialdehyde dehydrogenase
VNLHAEMLALAERARAAAYELAAMGVRKKNAILLAMADGLESRKAVLFEANRRDMEEGRSAGLSEPMLDRLLLTEPRLTAMVRGLRAVAALKDPIGTKISRWIRPNGLEIVKLRVPIGVIAVIYESRPNVTADTAGLCFKSGNAVILRGGKEARHSNAAIADLLIESGRAKDMPEHAVQLVRTQDRDAVRELVQLTGKIDLAIPRGGEALIRSVTEAARIPVIKHYKGVCHIFVDESASEPMAVAVVENAKCQRPATCNAVEKLLVHEKAAERLLPPIAARLVARGVELRGDPAACRIVPGMKPAAESDWHEEYLDLILAVKIVPSVRAAIDHINRYGSNHSDAILTENEVSAQQFTRDVDSAAVFVNASTRFTDGGEFGMGAEIGISTDKLHARGPMGLEELTTYKYVVRGSGQLRE